jgi:hypothetical protein
MFGEIGGNRFDAPFTIMIQELTANPLDSDGACPGGYEPRARGDRHVR